MLHHCLPPDRPLLVVRMPSHRIAIHVCRHTYAVSRPCQLTVASRGWDLTLAPSTNPPRREESILAAIAELAGNDPSHFRSIATKPSKLNAVRSPSPAKTPLKRMPTVDRAGVSNKSDEDRDQDGAAGRAQKHPAGRRVLVRKRRAHAAGNDNLDSATRPPAIEGCSPFGAQATEEDDNPDATGSADEYQA